MTDAARRARRTNVVLFAATVVLNGTISLVTIPILVAVAGADHWASMATGQSIGASFAVLVIFGWGLTGPVSIATAAVAARPAIFLDSLFARVALLIPVLLVQTVVTMAIVPHEKFVALVAGFAMTLAGASANWYFIGESRAGRFLVLDTVPRVAGTVAGGVLLFATGSLLAFAAAQLVGAAVAIVISAVVILRGRTLDLRQAARWGRILSSLREQRHGVVATGIVAAYTPAMLGIIAVFSPALLPTFVLADRIAKFAGMAVSPMFQVLQGWVPAARGRELVRRIRTGGLITLATGVAGGVAYALLLPLVGEVLTHGQVTYTPLLAFAFGLLCLSQMVSPFLSTVALMAVGRVRLIAASASIGVMSALLALLGVELLGMPQLAVWTIVAGNAAVIIWQSSALRGSLADLSSEEPTPPHPGSSALTPALTPNTTDPLLSTDGASSRRTA